MSLDSQQVQRVATLARLAVDEKDLPAYARELSQILDMVDELSAADTGEVPPMAHPLDMVQRLREDAVTEADQRERFQANAPAVEGGHFLVPRVIE